jgi:phosphopantothenoylcysteine synthetase/decarboxylase
MKKLSSPKVKKHNSLRLLHVLTGSIAAYKAGDLSKALRDENWQVDCVLTKGAEKFVTPLTIHALSGGKVYQDAFSLDDEYPVLHTSLAEDSDVILVAPASASFIARLAAGMADDLASCVILATRKPVLLIPAMNDQMYHHPITQENLSKLKRIGYRVMEPIEGKLVCGKYAMGHIPEIKSILSFINVELKK